MLSRFFRAFLLRGKRLLILWLQSPSAVILEPKKIKSATVSTVFIYVILPTSVAHYWSRTSLDRCMPEVSQRACRLGAHGPMENSVTQRVTCAMIEIHTVYRRAAGREGPILLMALGSAPCPRPFGFLLSPQPASSHWNCITRMLMQTVLPVSGLSSRWPTGGQNLSTSGLFENRPHV